MVQVLGACRADCQNATEDQGDRPYYGVLLRLLGRRTDSRFRTESTHKSRPPEAGWSMASHWEAGLLELGASAPRAGEQRVQVSPGPLFVSRPRYPALDAGLGTPNPPQAPFRRAGQVPSPANLPLACLSEMAFAETISRGRWTSQLADPACLRPAAIFEQGHCVQRIRRKLQAALDPIPVRPPHCPRLETGVGTPAWTRVAALPIPLLRRGVAPRPALPPAESGLTLAAGRMLDEYLYRGLVHG